MTHPLWEYLIFDFGPDGYPGPMLDMQGRLGWELVSAVQRADGRSTAIRYIFKRRL